MGRRPTRGAVIELTAGHCNRATLARQLLLARAELDVVAALQQVVAVQAQEPASVHVALWNRVAGLDLAAVDAALATRRVLRSTSLRITLHAVAAVDHPTWRAAMRSTLRAARLRDRRYAGAGLAPQDADALLPALLVQLATPHDSAAAQRWIAAHRGDAAPEEQGPGEQAQWLWWALRHTAALVHDHREEAAWGFPYRPTYVTAPDTSEPDAGAAVQELVLRYLAAFGPATRQDVGQFALLPQRVVRPAVEALGARLVHHVGPDGADLLDVPGAPLPDPDTPAPPRLLGMWDNVLLAHVDRSRVLPAPYRAQVIRSNGDTLPTLLVDGHVAGVWRPVDGGIEATAFAPLDTAAWDGLASEAATLSPLLAARDPATYGRYRRWWERLPVGEVRVLPAG